MITQLLNTKRRPVANHFVINNNKGQFLQSYRSIVANISPNGDITLGEDYNYSKTTRKYLNIFLNVNTTEFKDNLKKGLYKIDNNLTV